MVKRRAAGKTVRAFTDRIPELTPRMTGSGLRTVTERLRVSILGWKAYFRLARTPRVWRMLYKWICHRLRTIVGTTWNKADETTALGRVQTIC
jgi:RNA-directed DNA polymerase